MRGCALAIVAHVAVAGCSRDRGNQASAADDPPPPRAARVDASDLIAKFQCTRCHDVPGSEPAPRDKHCVRCHQQIHEGTFPADPEVLAEWRTHIVSLRWVPSLAGADRLRRTWIREFLLAPHDVRPGLVAEMPRLAITADDAERLAAHFAPADDDRSDVEPRAVTRGEQLYRGFACGRCHRFSGAAVDNVALHAAGEPATGVHDGSWQLAPDLRHARERMTVASIAAWIAEPRGAMPRLGVTSADARALAEMIVTTPLAAQPAREVPARLPVLTRDVTWDEVESRVFRKVCWHCHAVPELARGDGGPGNSGGFGFAPRGLDLSSYTGISGGALDDHGERRSVFAKLADGTPRIVAHLHARYLEEAGGARDGVRGMPLGLPPLSLEDIQLVETWIAQGRPR